MNKSEIIYLELLSAALLNRSLNEHLFADMSDYLWKEVCDLSDKQRTSAVIADSILTLPNDLLPPSSLKMKLVLQQEQIKAKNETLNKVLSEITKIYKSINLDTILLKGQGVALNYPSPLYRTPGDIDQFFLKEEDYYKANQWVREQDIPTEPESKKHLGLDWQNVHIENHRIMATFERSKYNYIYLEEEKRLIYENRWEKVIFNGLEVVLLPSTFNACYIFIHLFHHLIHSGVSVRQFSDWILLLLNNRDKINYAETERLFNRLALRRPAAIFAAAAVKHLGITPEISPIPLADLGNRYVDIVIKDLLGGCHFGRYYAPKKRPPGVWSGRWFSFKRTVNCSISMTSLSPQHFILLPFYKLMTRIKFTLR